MKRAKSISPEPSDALTLHPNTKRSKLDAEIEEYKYSLLDLSDDVLLHIFKYLSSFDLMSLHLCCSRLENLCCDRTLWKILDLRSKYLPLEELQKYIKFMQPVTKVLALRGAKIKNTLPEFHFNILEAINEKCDQLKEFILENYAISRDKIRITDFAKTLEKLSLEGCYVSRGVIPCRSYFYKIDIHMPHLTCLILTKCNWINFNSFMAISKIQNLKELRLNSCYGLSEDIAYPSLACRHGLKSLEVLDLRDTFIGDSVISSFSYTSTLTELYLECPNPDTEHVPSEDEHTRFQQVFLLYAHSAVAADPPPQENVNYEIYNTDQCQISDRSVCSLGLHPDGNNQEIIQNRNEVQLVQGRPRTLTNPNFKKLVIRNYIGITNQILLHFARNGPNLEYLDVTGTSVTKEGVQWFKIVRPNVNLISSIDEI